MARLFCQRLLRRNLFLRSIASLPCKSFDLNTVLVAYRSPSAADVSQLSSAHTGSVYRIALPPPNVTGKLHLGHALTVTIEDVLCRYRRLCGDQVVWYAGFDHAGIATQTVVEKHLWMTKKLMRNQLTKEEFLSCCNEWTNGRIEDMRMQLNRMGTMLNVQNAYFTMDQRFSEAVKKAFCELYSRGVIVRDRRMVNWCPTLQSTISDQEVNSLDLSRVDEISIPSREFGFRKLKVGALHRISYELVNRRGFVEVATTRPETVFADVALAVNAKDDRYSHLIGKMVRHPLMPNRFLPIIEDEAVNPEKGTGVLKITPSHDFLDFEIAKRHVEELPLNAFTTSCIDEKGLLVNTKELDGLDRFEAREKKLSFLTECFSVIEQLRAVNAYGGVMKHSDGMIPICNRTGDVIEPIVKEQWFLNCTEMNERLLHALSCQKIRVKPIFLTSHLEEWLRKNEPWCLSRQLYWGHRVPAYRLPDSKDWVVAESFEEAQKKFSSSFEKNALIQDDDVLDTWFSSSLVPLVLAGWPEKKNNSSFLTTMETGYDILGFWVARMLTVCEQLSGCYPFTDILLHGLIRDSRNRKMSKSLGNVIDPDDIINGIGIQEMLKRVDNSSLPTADKNMLRLDLRKSFPEGIKQFGADALRFAMLRHDVAGLDIKMDVVGSADEGYRFCNKLWNLCNYSLMVFSASAENTSDVQASLHVADRWILSCLATTLLKFDSYVNDFCLNQAATLLQKFIQAYLCDFYLETTKQALRKNDVERLAVIARVLRTVLENSLATLSVIMPFISQYLFDKIKGPEVADVENFVFGKTKLKAMICRDLEEEMEIGIALASTIRSIRAQLRLSSENHLKVYFTSVDCELLRVSETIGSFSNATLIHENSAASDYLRYCLPFSVPGHHLALYVKLDEEYSCVVRDKLVKQLESKKGKRQLAEKKIERLQLLCKEENVKPSIVVKNLQRIQQAKRAVQNAEEEIKKLKDLLVHFKASQ